MEDLLFPLLKYGAVIFIGYILLSLLLSPPKALSIVHSRWFHLFDGLQYSSDDLYSALENSLNKRQMPDIEIRRVEFSSFYNQREYLCIERGKQIFYVCAAPFGDSFFVSWWFGEPHTFAKDFLPRIPFFGKSLSNLLLMKSFFVLDSDTMFKELVAHCIKDVVNQITDTHTRRGLTESEYKSVDRPLPQMV